MGVETMNITISSNGYELEAYLKRDSGGYRFNIGSKGLYVCTGVLDLEEIYDLGHFLLWVTDNSKYDKNDYHCIIEKLKDGRALIVFESSVAGPLEFEEIHKIGSAFVTFGSDDYKETRASVDLLDAIFGSEEIDEEE
jgi:hypothetical protein